MSENETLAPPLRTSIASMLVEKVVDNSFSNTKRGQRSNRTTMAVLQKYEQLGGKL